MSKESMTHYESVGDKLMASSRWTEAERAISHAMGDCCKIPVDNYNMLPDYKRLLKKHIECLEHIDASAAAAALGRKGGMKGGKSRSAAKLAAVRANGAKGGRPKGAKNRPKQSRDRI